MRKYAQHNPTATSMQYTEEMKSQFSVNAPLATLRSYRQAFLKKRSFFGQSLAAFITAYNIKGGRSDTSYISLIEDERIKDKKASFRRGWHPGNHV